LCIKGFFEGEIFTKKLLVLCLHTGVPVETDPMTVRTVENEEAILDAFEECTESIREVAQELNINT
jgi:hypothetical protein